MNPPRNPDEFERELFYQALKDLSRESIVKWFYLYRVYCDYEDDRRDWWIRQIKKQAASGLPMAHTVLAKVTELRVTL
jgi:hypothetical protein